MRLSGLFLLLSCAMPVVIVGMGIVLDKNHVAVLYAAPLSFCFLVLFLWVSELESNIDSNSRPVTQHGFILFLKGCWIFVETYLWLALIYVLAGWMAVPNADNFFRNAFAVSIVMVLLFLRFRIFGNRPAPADRPTSGGLWGPDIDTDIIGESDGGDGDGGIE